MRASLASSSNACAPDHCDRLAMMMTMYREISDDEQWLNWILQGTSGFGL